MFYLIAIIILSLHTRLIYGISCKGEYNVVINHKEVLNYGSIPKTTRNNLDFFVGIRPPADKLENGKDSSWKWSNRALADKESIIGKTFEKVYSNPEQYYFIQYSTSKGSGALVWSKKESEQRNAIWFIHSSHYLNSFSDKTYSPSTSKKASNFMCLSIKVENVQKVIDRLFHAGIITGNFKVNTNKEPIYAENSAVMSKLLENDRSKLYILSTVLKEPVLIVTKSKSDRGLFWVKVSRKIGVNELYVKSNSIPPINTANPKKNCRNQISNVLEMIFIDKNGHSLNWETNPNLDQSNWGICRNEMDCYCISDIDNTITGSENTKGMAVCIFNSNLHKAFKDSIKRSAC